MQKNNSFVMWTVIVVIILAAIAVWQFHSYKHNDTDAGTASSTSQTTGTDADTIPSDKGVLDGLTFRYTSYDNTVIPAGEDYIISFASGQIQGKICNSFSGPYTAANGTLNTTITRTQVACTSPKDIAAAEQIFDSIMLQSSTYKLASTALTISGSGHTVVLNAFSR